MIDTTQKNLYLKLHELDFNGKAGKKLQQLGYRKQYDGRWSKAVSPGWDGPWIHQHRAMSRRRMCDLWHQTFFTITGQTPTYCKDCWKVVVNIPTVEKLFQLYEVQKKLNHTCKCGLELRPTDSRKYGGYFYNDSKEEGLDCLEKVKPVIQSEIGSDVDVFLKCACSEYEIANGPPEDYVAPPEQLLLESMFEKHIVPNTVSFEQSLDDIAYTMLKWIHHAAEHGDLTYMKFTDGVDILPQMKKYQRENNENGKDST